MAGKIQLTPAELLAQSQEMLSLQKEFESLFGQTNTLLAQVNQNWSANLANNFVGKLTSAQKSFANVTAMLEQGGNLAATSARTFESMDVLLSKVMSGDTAAMVGNTKVMAASMSLSDPSYSDSSNSLLDVIDFFKEDMERHPEIYEDFIQDIMGMIPVKWTDLKTIVNTTVDVFQGEADWSTVWEVVKSATDDTIYGKAIHAIFENVETLQEYNQMYLDQATEHIEDGNVGATVITTIGSGVDCLLVGSIESVGDIFVEIWDGFPGTNMFEKVFGVDVSEGWQGFTEGFHDVVYDFTTDLAEFAADVEEATEEFIDDVVDVATDVIDTLGDGFNDVKDGLTDWWDSLW